MEFLGCGIFFNQNKNASETSPVNFARGFSAHTLFLTFRYEIQRFYNKWFIVVQCQYSGGILSALLHTIDQPLQLG